MPRERGRREKEKEVIEQRERKSHGRKAERTREKVWSRRRVTLIATLRFTRIKVCLWQNAGSYTNNPELCAVKRFSALNLLSHCA